MIAVDLGCGPHKRRPLGIDRVAWPGVDYVLALGFDPLPFPDNSIDEYVAYDVLEHLPVTVWSDRDGQWRPHYPRIFLLAEIYRTLQPGGTFYSETPSLLPEWAQDPTHEAPPWVPETWRYFCGQMGDVPRYYGIAFGFELLDIAWTHHHLCVTVKKPV